MVVSDVLGCSVAALANLSALSLPRISERGFHPGLRPGLIPLLILRFELCVEVSLLCSSPTTVCEVKVCLLFLILCY